MRFSYDATEYKFIQYYARAEKKVNNNTALAAAILYRISKPVLMGPIFETL